MASFEVRIVNVAGDMVNDSFGDEYNPRISIAMFKILVDYT